MFTKLYGIEREIIMAIHNMDEFAAFRHLEETYAPNGDFKPIREELKSLKYNNYINFTLAGSKATPLNLILLPNCKNYPKMEADYDMQQNPQITVYVQGNNGNVNVAGGNAVNVNGVILETEDLLTDEKTDVTVIIKNFFNNNKEQIESLYDSFKNQNYEYESCPPEKLSEIRCDILLTTATNTETHILHGYLKSIGNSGKILRFYKGNYVYYVAQLGCYIVAHIQSNAGSNNLGRSYDTLNEAISVISPKMVFSVGIAFGINPDRQKIGDVLVADTIFPYDMNKISEGEVKIKNTWFPQTPQYLINRIAQSKTLSGTGYNLLQGGIVTGGSVVDDALYKTMIIKPFNAFNIIGGEMEAYGVYKQAFEKKIMCITIKSVCDYAESKNDLSEYINENETIKDGIQLLGMDNVCKVIEELFKDKYIFADLKVASIEEAPTKQNQISENKYVVQAKAMILARYKRNRAKPGDMIMTNELFQIKYDCQNPKVAEVIDVAINELIEAGFIKASGLGIHLSNKGYDAIF